MTHILPFFTSFKAFWISIVFFLTFSGVQAQWKQCNGLKGENITCFGVIDSTIYAGGNGGLYCSTDNGESWKITDFTFPIQTMSVSGNTLYVGVSASRYNSNDGIYKSTDKGIHWDIIDSTNYWDEVYSIITNGSTIVIGTKNGIYLSQDDGMHWRNLKSEYSITAIELIDTVLFIGTRENGIFKSIDYGGNWVPLNNGIPYQYSTYYSEISLIKHFGGTLLAANNYTGPFYISKNGGSSWNEIRVGLKAGNTVKIPGGYSFLEFDSTIFVGSYSGVFQSADSGVTWQQFSHCIEGMKVQSFARFGSSLFAGTAGAGIYKSTENGRTWKQVNTGLPSVQVIALSSVGETIFAGTATAGFYKSDDKGENWKNLITGIYNTDLYRSIYKSPSLTSNDSILYLSAFYGGRLLSKSFDKGESWTNYDSIFKDQYIITIAAAGSKVLVGTEGNGVFRSSDYCKTWHRDTTVTQWETILSLVLSDSTLFIGTEYTGLAQYNINTGKSKYILLGDHSEFSEFNIAVSKQHVMASIASYANFGYNVSTDFGKTWKPAKEYLLGPFAVKDNTVFAAKYPHLILQSNDNGETFFEIDSLEGRYIYALYVLGSTLYAATDSGIWKHEVSFTGVEEVISPSSTRLTCYPTPAANSLTIDRRHLDFLNTIPVHYSISTLTGQKIMGFEREELQFVLPLESLVNGVYILTASQGAERSATLFNVLR
ncbi:MAG: hypothetical protein IPM69_04705 [Ignavibacteria bacterium]|nr:hypothetical protein [Ignavibacteria bacterium]